MLPQTSPPAIAGHEQGFCLVLFDKLACRRGAAKAASWHDFPLRLHAPPLSRAGRGRRGSWCEVLLFRRARFRPGTSFLFLALLAEWNLEGLHGDLEACVAGRDANGQGTLLPGYSGGILNAHISGGLYHGAVLHEELHKGLSRPSALCPFATGNRCPLALH